MIYTGNIEKMTTQIGQPVIYSLPIGSDFVLLNALIGKNIRLIFKKQINCTVCGKITNKSFAQGFCYSCFAKAPEASECILHPEKCQAQYGISRDQKWSENHCLQPHVVYLANSSGLKVGITRKTQVPTRWMDQGAIEAIILAEVPNRHMSGVIETHLMQHYNDKTNWRNMLTGKIEKINLLEEKDKAIDHLPKALKQFAVLENSLQKISYPLDKYPEKISSVSFDKMDMTEGTLTGIKGQYLYFNHSTVLNIRKHRGYWIELHVE